MRCKVLSPFDGLEVGNVIVLGAIEARVLELEGKVKILKDNYKNMVRK